MEIRTKAYQTRIIELESLAVKDRESMIALQVTVDELTNEKVLLAPVPVPNISLTLVPISNTRLTSLPMKRYCLPLSLILV